VFLRDFLQQNQAVYPALTSIRYTIDLGERIIEIILALSTGQTIPPALLRPLVPHLIQREST
jgi:DNA-binding LacI/PurR family transcriptional regulator